MSWASVIGQSRIKDLLTASLERNRLSHAYLFSGQEGSGKFAVALELAKIVNCARGGMEACDECSSCRKFETLQHPNVHLIFSLPVGKNEKSNDFPLAKLSDEEMELVQEQLRLKAANPYHKISVARANIIKINSIREIRREASLTMFGAGKRVFLIIDADKMNDEAANALLKTLEEPHSDTLLLLLTAAPDALLQTIFSRCQHIRFDPLNDDVISTALQERKGLKKEHADAVSQMAGGDYSKALQCIDSDYYDQQKYAIEFLRIMLFKPRNVFIEEIEKLVKDRDRSEITGILRLIQRWFRDAMIWDAGLEETTADEMSEAMKKFVINYPQWNYTRSIELLERTVSLLDKNVYIPLLLTKLTVDLKQLARNSSGV